LTLEAIRPFTLRLHGRVQSVAQGQTLELDTKDAERLLQAAPDRVRHVTLVEATSPAQPIHGVKPVYWESMDGSILGPAEVLSVTQDGGAFWLCLNYDRFLYWIRDGLLRSRQAFEAQKQWCCSCCQGRDFWSSPYRSHICCMCHPPANPALIKEGRR
jgi:hypothetical protein